MDDTQKTKKARLTKLMCTNINLNNICNIYVKFFLRGAWWHKKESVLWMCIVIVHGSVVHCCTWICCTLLYMDLLYTAVHEAQWGMQDCSNRTLITCLSSCRGCAGTAMLLMECWQGWIRNGSLEMVWSSRRTPECGSSPFCSLRFVNGTVYISWEAAGPIESHVRNLSLQRCNIKLR